MGKVLYHSYPDTNMPWRRTFSYGRCMVGAWAANGLWFVTIPRNGWQDQQPLRDWTFIVDRQSATPIKMDEFGLNLEKWRAVAHASVEGDFCSEYECLWKDIPYFVFTFPDGKKARFGMSHTPHPEEDGEYLWYVVFGRGVENPEFSAFGVNTYIVPKEYTEPSYMRRMTSDPERWSLAAWSHPANDYDPRLVSWENDLTKWNGNRAFDWDERQASRPFVVRFFEAFIGWIQKNRS